MNPKSINLISVCVVLACFVSACSGPVPTQSVPAVPDKPQAPSAQTGKPSYTPGPDDPAIFFLEPIEGDSVSSPMPVRFGVSRLDLADKQIFLVIDQACVAAGGVMTPDAQHLVYKQGRSSLALELSAGQHRLCLQVADNSGVVLDGPGMLQVIDIIVE